MSIDDFAKSNPPPTVIKCDVEGAEVEVLKGARETLRAYHPLILCEMHSPAMDRTAREILLELGYSLEAVDETHVLAIGHGDQRDDHYMEAQTSRRQTIQ
ncbi:MAG: FkbM family methyltransferase [Candidatus Acidiferrum sp.]